MQVYCLSYLLRCSDQEKIRLQKGNGFNYRYVLELWLTPQLLKDKRNVF
jgi:hypothetical protein